MTTRHYLGENTKAILNTLDANGPMSRDQVVAATGIERDTVRQYLRRCAFRGLVTVDRTGLVPAYTVRPTWRERLEPKRRPEKPKPAPQTTVARAIARAPALHTIWMN